MAMHSDKVYSSSVSSPLSFKLSVQEHDNIIRTLLEAELTIMVKELTELKKSGRMMPFDTLCAVVTSKHLAYKKPLLETDIIQTLVEVSNTTWTTEQLRQALVPSIPLPSRIQALAHMQQSIDKEKHVVYAMTTEIPDLLVLQRLLEVAKRIQDEGRLRDPDGQKHALLELLLTELICKLTHSISNNRPFAIAVIGEGCYNRPKVGRYYGRGKGEGRVNRNGSGKLSTVLALVAQEAELLDNVQAASKITILEHVPLLIEGKKDWYTCQVKEAAATLIASAGKLGLGISYNHDAPSFSVFGSPYTTSRWLEINSLKTNDRKCSPKRRDLLRIPATRITSSSERVHPLFALLAKDRQLQRSEVIIHSVLAINVLRRSPQDESLAGAGITNHTPLRPIPLLLLLAHAAKECVVDVIVEGLESSNAARDILGARFFIIINCGYQDLVKKLSQHVVPDPKTPWDIEVNEAHHGLLDTGTQWFEQHSLLNGITSFKSPDSSLHNDQRTYDIYLPTCQPEQPWLHFNRPTYRIPLQQFSPKALWENQIPVYTTTWLDDHEYVSVWLNLQRQIRSVPVGNDDDTTMDPFSHLDSASTWEEFGEAWMELGNDLCSSSSSTSSSEDDNPPGSPGQRALALWMKHQLEDDKQWRLFTKEDPIDCNLSPFANMVARFYNVCDVVYDTMTLHGPIFLSWITALASSRGNDTLKGHIMFMGESEVGKSYIGKILEHLCVPDTVVRISDVSAKAFQSKENLNDVVYYFDELPTKWVRQNNDAGNPVLKSVLTHAPVGSLTRQGKSTKTVTVSHSFVVIGNTNESCRNMHSSMMSRFLLCPLPTMRLPDRANDSVHVGSNNTQIMEWRNEWDVSYRTLHLIVALAEQAICLGKLDEPEMAVMNVMLQRMKKLCETHGIVAAIRDNERILSLARTLTILNAAYIVFRSSKSQESMGISSHNVDIGGNSEESMGVRDRNVIRFEDLELMDPYLVCTMEIAVFTITLVSYQYVSPIETLAERQLWKLAKPVTDTVTSARIVLGKRKDESIQHALARLLEWKTRNETISASVEAFLDALDGILERRNNINDSDAALEFCDSPSPCVLLSSQFAEDLRKRYGDGVQKDWMEEMARLAASHKCVTPRRIITGLVHDNDPQVLKVLDIESSADTVSYSKWVVDNVAPTMKPRRLVTNKIEEDLDVFAFNLANKTQVAANCVPVAAVTSYPLSFLKSVEMPENAQKNCDDNAKMQVVEGCNTGMEDVADVLSHESGHNGGNDNGEMRVVEGGNTGGGDMDRDL